MRKKSIKIGTPVALTPKPPQLDALWELGPALPPPGRPSPLDKRLSYIQADDNQHLHRAGSFSGGKGLTRADSDENVVRDQMMMSMIAPENDTTGEDELPGGDVEEDPPEEPEPESPEDPDEPEEQEETDAQSDARMAKEKAELRQKRTELLTKGAGGGADALVTYLQTVPVFTQLEVSDVAKIAASLRAESYPEGALVIQQGETADALGKGFFIIKSGRARIFRTLGEKKKKQVDELDLIEEGDYFGEAALLTNQARGASVQAVGGTLEVLVLDRHFFAALLSAGKLKQDQFAKRKGVHDTRDDGVRVSHQVKDTVKTEKVVKLIYLAVKNNVLFSGMAYYGVLKVISRMWRVPVPKGEAIIKQGDVGDNFYVVEKGRFKVQIMSGDGKKVRQIDKIGPNECFGELALMYNTPRSATITCTSKAVLWVVDRFTFRRILRNVSAQKLREYEKFLAHVKLLAPLSASERAKVAQALDEQKFRAGQVIVKQSSTHEKGDDSMYLISRGTVKVERSQEDGTVGHVRTLERGDCFGERALITNEPRSATVTAVTVVEALKLDRHAFQLLLGPLEDILANKVAGIDEGDRSRGSLIECVPPKATSSPQSAAPVIQRPPIDRQNLLVVGTLGKGSFGSVQLVKDQSTGETYALKRISKSKVTKAKHQAHLMNEKRMLSRLDHPSIIALFATYKDQKNLYFLLEPVLGGELYTLLRAQSIFDNNTAKFFIASVVSAFEYMHSLNIIYRDLKPENCLMDSKGFLKIADFGFAKELDEDGQTFTLCGTPAYLAPEIIAGKGHGKAVDWWCMGIFMYELLAGFTPFHLKEKQFNAMKLYERIARGHYVCPGYFSEDAVDLIGAFLVRKPTKRLGVLHGGSKQVRQHPWLATFDWAALESGSYRAPIIPFISDNTDMSNFTYNQEDHHDIRTASTYNAKGVWDEDF